jgi:O-antigen/teichoic acid export membrane protein
MEFTAVAKQIIRGRGGIAIADQVMVSASNFVAGVVLVRALGLAEFGKYAVAYAVLLYANSLQMSFVGSPMLSIAPLIEGDERTRFLNGMFSLQLIASGLLFATSAILGIIAYKFTHFLTLQCTFLFACCIGTFQLQDWARRYYFLERKPVLALTSDFISYTIQLGIFFLCWRMGALSLLRTFAIMVVTSVVGFAMVFLTEYLRASMRHLSSAWRQCKSLSKGVAIANQARWLGLQGILLIGASILGPTSIGGLRASQNLSGPAYLFLIATENVIPLRLAEVLKSRGKMAGYHFIQRTIGVCTLVFGAVVVLVGIFGRQILGFLYGPELKQYYVPMLFQLFSIVVQAAITMWFFLYRGIGDTQALVRASLIGAFANLVGVYPLGVRWGASGIVMSTLFGQAFTLIFCWIHWRKHAKSDVSHETASA